MIKLSNMMDKVLLMVPFESYEEYEQKHRDLIKEVVRELVPQTPSKKNSELYGTRQEVAKAIHVSLPTLNSLTKYGILQGYRLGGRILYKWDEIDSALTQVETLKYRKER
jgi:hypothetical protein